MATRRVRIGRRALLGGAGSVFAIGRARAADRITVATWAGEYGDLLAYTVDNPQMKPLDITVTQELAAPPVRRSKMMAERGLSRGSLDVVFLDDLDAAAMAAMNLWEPLSQIDIPNLPEVYPGLRVPYAVPHVFSALVIAYNPDTVIPAPSSFGDLWDPRLRNRIGFADSLALYNVGAAALAHGGSMTDLGPGMASLRDLKKLGVQTYASNEDLVKAFATGAVWVAPMWLARIAYWQRMNVPVAHAYPEEGAIAYAFNAGVPANSPNKPAAKRYVNATLEPAVQATFALRLGYAPSIANARLTGTLERAVAFTADERTKLHRMSYSYVAENGKHVQDYWQNDFKIA